MTLSEKDLEILITDKGSRLITGPPGSGKTHTLIKLVKYLILKKNIDPSQVLIFSFNRRWSKILREKTADTIGRSLWEIPIVTFYSFCIDVLEWDLLEKYRKSPGGGIEPGLGIDVLNSVEQWDILTGIVRELDKNDYPYSMRYMDSGSHVSGSYLQEVFDFILRAQENLIEPGVLLKKFMPAKHPLLAELSGIYSRYTRVLEEKEKYNYGMLLLKTAKLLKKDVRLRQNIRERFKYIIIDEFQETNSAQNRIISGISNNNCIFFGNDDQAIYGFRGSVTDNFKQLYRKLEPQKKILMLNKNYRNSADIIMLSSDFMGQDDSMIPKENIPNKDTGESGEIWIRSFPTAMEETGKICHKILELNKNHEVRLEDIAILVKGLGYETHLVEEALSGSGIPFVRRSSRSLMDNRYVSYIIDFLKLVSILNKNGISKNSGESGGMPLKALLENILLSDAVSIDPLFLGKLKSAYSRKGKSETLNFWSYILDYTGDDKDDDRENGFRESLSKVIERISYYSDIAGRDILDFLMDFLDDPLVGLFKFLRTDNSQEALRQAVSISTGDYLKSVMEYVKGSGNTDLDAYLDFIQNLETNQFLEEVEESIEEQVQPGMVNIMSFHQCKGLEFEAVFIPFMNSNYLPSKFKNQQVFDIQFFRNLAEGKKLDPVQLQKEHMAGEIRLFYNGLTRAKNYLYVTCCKSRSSSVFFDKLKDCRDKLEEKRSRSPEPKIGTRSSDSRWMLKKKALAAFCRQEMGRKTDPKRVIGLLKELDCSYPPDMWWSYNRVTENKNSPLEKVRRSYSATRLNTYRDCPFKYKIQYYFGIAGEESINLIVGNAYHEILQRFFEEDRHDISWERLKNIVKKVLEEKELGFPSMKRQLINKAFSDFERYHGKHLPGEPSSSRMETDFKFDIEGDLMRGRIDQINFGADGSMELVDFKSGPVRYNERDLEDEIQLKIYRLAMEKDSSLQKMKIPDIKMKYLSLGSEKKAEYFLPEEYYDQEELIARLKEIISGIKSEEFRAEPVGYNTCSYCDFKIVCPKFYGKYD